jgi:hypothetical protein
MLSHKLKNHLLKLRTKEKKDKLENVNRRVEERINTRKKERKEEIRKMVELRS